MNNAEEIATRAEPLPHEIHDGNRRIYFVGIHYKLDTPALCPTTKSGKMVTEAIEFLRSDIKEGVTFIRSNLYPGFKVPDDYKTTGYVPYWVLDWEFTKETDIAVVFGNLIGDQFLYAQRAGIIDNLVRMTHPSAVWSKEDKKKWFLDLERRLQDIIHPVTKNCVYWRKSCMEEDMCDCPVFRK